MNQRGFILPSFFMSPTGMLVAAVAALTITNFITYKLWRSEVAEYAQFRTDVETQSALLKAEMDRVKAESARVDAEAGAGWKAAAQYWESTTGGRITVRVPADCNPGALPAISGATGVIAKPQVKEPGLSAAHDVTAAECEARLNAAIPDAAWIEHVKFWASEQRKASMKK